MKARPGPLLLAALLLNGCIATQPPAPKAVSSAAGDAAALAPMLQSATAGALRVRSVVYKPSALPLGGFLKKLSRGELKSAFASVHFKYAPSNVHDDALRTLIGRGYAPVLVVVTNEGAAPVDLKSLRLSLKDSSLELSPIPNHQLPQEFESLDPKAIAVNTYNVSAVVVGSAVLAVSVVLLVGLSRSPELPLLPDVDFSRYNELFNPVRVATPIDYNGLLYSPMILEPGKTAQGLLFYKARGADWGGLKLAAAYR